MNADLLPFQKFQMAFGRRIRDPRRTGRPSGVPARRMAVYEELLFNNITGFLDACFPVCRAILGEARWRRLNRAFFRDWRSPTPWFREIPREFLRYLQEGSVCQPLPRWFGELAHYEWVELALDISDAPTPPHVREGDLLTGTPVVNPALLNLAYAWPVNRIGPAYRPRKPEATYLIVFRDPADKVAFAASNPVTARLLALLGEGMTGRAACLAVAGEIAHPDPEFLVTQGGSVLEDLRRLGVILGVKP
ncbi:MAG: putative DNA-binding domain-containing protein [Dechloromonas sp.]|nr:putative DNA-binding domain-containing protein [Dechloromonas sp.]